MMKSKISNLLFCLCFFLFLSACGDNSSVESESGDGSSDNSAETEENSAEFSETSEREFQEIDLLNTASSDLLDVPHEQFHEVADQDFDIQNSDYIDDNVIIRLGNERIIGMNWRNGDPVLSEDGRVSYSGFYYYFTDEYVYFYERNDEQLKKVSFLPDASYDVEEVSDEEFEYATSTFYETYRYVFEDIDQESDDRQLGIKAYDGEELVWENQVPGREWHLNILKELDDYVFLYVNDNVDSFVLDKHTGEILFEEEWQYYMDAYQVGDKIYLVTNAETGSDLQLYVLDSENWEKELLLEFDELRRLDDAHFIYENGTLAIVTDRNIIGIDAVNGESLYNIFYDIEGADPDIGAFGSLAGEFQWFEKQGILYALAEQSDTEYGFTVIDIHSGEILSHYSLDNSHYYHAYLQDITDNAFIIYRKNGVFEFGFTDVGGKASFDEDEGTQETAEADENSDEDDPYRSPYLDGIMLKMGDSVTTTYGTSIFEITLLGAELYETRNGSTPSEDRGDYYMYVNLEVENIGETNFDPQDISTIIYGDDGQLNTKIFMDNPNFWQANHSFEDIIKRGEKAQGQQLFIVHDSDRYEFIVNHGHDGQVRWEFNKDEVEMKSE